VLDIYILLMVLGLSGGIGATNVVHTIASGTASSFTPKEVDPAAKWGK